MNKKPIPREVFEGAVSVEGDLTPITRQPIVKITPERWNEMSANELLSQREVLFNRYHNALRAGLMDGAKTIQAGIAILDARLEDMDEDGPGFL